MIPQYKAQQLTEQTNSTTASKTESSAFSDLDAQVERILEQGMEANRSKIESILLKSGATKEELPKLFADIKESTRLDLLKKFEEKLHMIATKNKEQQSKSNLARTS